MKLTIKLEKTMKKIIQHQTYGEIVYEESAWLGKKSVSIGGIPLEKISKKEFKMQDGSTVTVNGGFLQGSTLNIQGETIELTLKIKWYEIMLCIFPLLLTLTWGNSRALCSIIPIVGGAIGGGIGGLFSMICLLCIKCVKPIWLKIIIAIAFFAVTFGICCGIGYAFFAAVK